MSYLPRIFLNPNLPPPSFPFLRLSSPSLPSPETQNYPNPLGTHRTDCHSRDPDVQVLVLRIVRPYRAVSISLSLSLSLLKTLYTIDIHKGFAERKK